MHVSLHLKLPVLSFCCCWSTSSFDWQVDSVKEHLTRTQTDVRCHSLFVAWLHLKCYCDSDSTKVATIQQGSDFVCQNAAPGFPEKALNLFFFFFSFWISHCQLCELWKKTAITIVEFFLWGRCTGCFEKNFHCNDDRIDIATLFPDPSRSLASQNAERFWRLTENCRGFRGFAIDRPPTHRNLHRMRLRPWPVYPRKWAPAKTCTCPYYASVLWFFFFFFFFWCGGKILQSNAAAKMCTNREFDTQLVTHAVHFAHGGQNLLLSFDCRSAWFWRFCTLPGQNLPRHKTCVLLTRLFHLVLSSNFAFPKKCTRFRREESQFMLIAHRWRWCHLQNSCKYRCFIRVLSCIAFSRQFLASQQNKKNKTKTWITSWQKEKRSNTSNNKWSATVSKCSPSSKTLAKSGLEPDSYTNRTDHTQPLYRLSQILIFMLLFNSKIVQFRIRVHCSQINHAFVSIAAMSSDCTLPPCGLWWRLAKKENKHRWSPHHMQLLWRNWAQQSSQVQHQLTCMVHIFAGGTNTRERTPRKWAPWCSFSRMVHKKINHRLSIEYSLGTPVCCCRAKMCSKIGSSLCAQD